MSRVLLDTHALLWAVAEPERLSPLAARALADETTELLVSAASAWEIATKHRLGKLPHAGALLDRWEDSLARLHARSLPIEDREARRAGGYVNAHRDPFDRLLAAQAELGDIALMSGDPAFGQFPVTVLW